MNERMTRRTCLKTSAAALGSWMVLPSLSARTYAANEKVDLGFIGVGGRGGANLKALAELEDTNVVAVSDVDHGRLKNAAERFGGKPYVDFRELLDQENGLDGFVVSTPDHQHAVASVMGMKQGLHCYCEKPLTHDIYESRVMAELAAEKNLVTHMGTGAQSHQSSVDTLAALRAGVIGDVKEVHVWTNRPIWPQGFEKPEGSDPVPETLDWDLWLGTAPERPYVAKWPEGHPARKERGGVVYHPFVWRGWWDFGTGALGDIAPHSMNIAFWALQLGAPESAEVLETSGMMPEMFPDWTILRLNFAASHGKPPLSIYWYDGNKTPPAELLEGAPGGGNPLFVGTKGKMRTGGAPYPVSDFPDYTPPETDIQPRDEIHAEWVQCIKQGKKTGCPFEYAGPMTEAYLLGNIALKVGRKVEWDAENMKVTNCPEANQYVRREYRGNWSL